MHVTNYLCGHVVEVTGIGKVGGCAGRFRKIDRDRMVDTETGEVIEVDHSYSRIEHIQSLRRSIRKLRMIINANFGGKTNELFITLTYAENMQDSKRLYRDFEVFYKRLKRRYRDCEFIYIVAVEPQERGAWHLHLLLKAINKEVLYIPNDEIAELWGQGFTKTKRLEQVDNVGAYLSAYLTDMDGKKGKRLWYYPPFMNIYRCSRGIKKPQVIKGDLGLNEDCKVYEKEFEVTRDGEVVNRVVIKQYNMRRGNGQ